MVREYRAIPLGFLFECDLRVCLYPLVRTRMIWQPRRELGMGKTLLGL